MKRVCLLICLLVGACFAETFVRLRLKHTDEDEERLTIQAYAGHPQRMLALTVAFAVPRNLHSEALWNETATQGDLPGLYAAVYISSADPLSRELVESEGTTVMMLPRLRLQSLGTKHSWNVNALFQQPALELHVPYSNRGLFLLGPGSATWLKARYARIMRNELQLRDTIDLTGYHPLPCQWRDEKGRCVLEQGGFRLRLEDKTGAVRFEKVEESGNRVILDLDSYTTQLPEAVSSRLLGKKPTSQRIDWAPPNGGPSWLLARASDLTPSALQSSSERRVAYATSKYEDDLVIGRRLALRLFSEMIYDSSEATWYVRAADTTERYNLSVRWVIAISLVLQALFVGRQLLHPGQVGVTNLLDSLYAGVPRASETRPHILHWAYSIAVVVTACVQLVLGQVYLGAGADVDFVRIPALRGTGIALSVMGAALTLVHFALLIVMKRERERHTLNVEFIAGATYTLVGLCGLSAALLPRASQGTRELVLLAALLALLVFYIIFHVMVSVHIIPRRFLYTASKGNPVLFQQQTLLWVVSSLLFTALGLALVFSGGDFVFAESVAIMTIKSSAATAVLLAQSLLLAVVITCVWVVQLEVFDVDLRHLRSILDTNKKD